MHNNERKFEEIKRTDDIKRLLILAIIVLIIAILVYSGVTKDIKLSQTIIDVGIGVLGGYGIGVSVSKAKE